ncbi:MAG: hypothetical protein AAGA54_21910 [Myxococcota bacterium]
MRRPRHSHARSKHARLVALGLLAATSACEELDLPPIRYETNRARIGTSFDEPLCAADLAWFDPQIEFIEQSLGVVRPEPVELYIYGNESLPCSGDPIGCYHLEEDVITGQWPSIDHEMVHAITNGRLSFPSKFWEEGAAEALSQEGTDRDLLVQLTPDVVRSNRRPSYDAAGHFVRFLYEDFGDEATQQPNSSRDDADVILEHETAYTDLAKSPKPWRTKTERYQLVASLLEALIRKHGTRLL